MIRGCIITEDSDPADKRSIVIMKTVKSGERIAYGIGGLGASAYQVMVMTFITYFYTDVFGISAAAVGTLMLVSRIWDGINDPVMGIIADRTNSRWGRFRPLPSVCSALSGC